MSLIWSDIGSYIKSSFGGDQEDPNTNAEPPKNSKPRGRPRGSYNILTPEEKAERKTMSSYQWTKLQKARK